MSLAVAVTMLVVAGCGTSSESARPPSPAPRTTTSLVTTATSAATTARYDRPCTRTLTPIFASVPPSPDLVGQFLEFPDSFGRDSNGNPVTQVGDTVVIDRPDGQVTLAIPNAGVYVRPEAIGDLDGDGRSDYIVTSAYGPDAAYFVSGTVTPGTHEPRTVGVRVRLPDAGVQFAPVGDQNGDHADDLMVVTNQLNVGGSPIVSGRPFVAARPGSTIKMPAPFATVPEVAGVLALDPSGPPTFVQMYGQFDHQHEPEPTDNIELRVLGTTVDCLVTTGDPPATTGPDETGEAVLLTAQIVDSHHIIQLRIDDKSLNTTYRWDLDQSS